MDETAADGPGPVSVVAGGTGVIGSEVGRQLARRGDEVWLIGRDEQRGESLASEITAETDGTARFVGADVASADDIDGVVELLRERGRLDRLVYAVGAFRRDRTTTPEGLEYCFAVNYLAAYRLCHGLVPLMAASAPARIVTLTASVSDTPIAFDDLQSETDYSLQDAYARSKRCLTAFTVELAERLAAIDDPAAIADAGERDGQEDADGTGDDEEWDWGGGEATADEERATDGGGVAVGADAVVPGFVPGGRAAEDLPAVLRGSFKLLSTLRLGTAPETAAERVLDPLLDDPGPTGRYFDEGTITDPPSFATDAEARARLWRESAELAGLDPDWL
jgi:NADP-dependent 3-hydroxy acid dehydrogenase YdfG